MRLQLVDGVVFGDRFLLAKYILCEASQWIAIQCLVSRKIPRCERCLLLQIQGSLLLLLL